VKTARFTAILIWHRPLLVVKYEWDRGLQNCSQEQEQVKTFWRNAFKACVKENTKPFARENR